MTKDNPGCYHDLRRYLVEKSGLPNTELIVLRRRMPIDDGRKICKKRGGKLYVKSAGGSWVLAPTKKQIKGGEFVLSFGPDDTKYLPITTLFECAYEAERAVKEFGIHVKDAGKYRDDLGGGWHSMVPMVQIDGNYFAYMECSC